MRSSISEQGTPVANANPCSRRSVAKAGPVSTSGLLRRGLDELVLLDLHLPDQLRVRRGLDDLVELGPIVGDEADALDDDVVDEPTIAPLQHPVVHRDLAATLGHDARAHHRLLAIQRIAEIGDLLAAVELDPRDVRALEEVREEPHEL